MLLILSGFHTEGKGLLLASERDTIRGVQIRADAVRIYMYGGTCAIIVAHATYTELGRSHFLYVPAISNIVTNGNGTGTKNVLKRTVRFDLSLVSSFLCSRRYYCSESKTIFYLDTVYCKILLYVSVEINPSTIGNLAPKLTYVTMITGTRI